MVVMNIFVTAARDGVKAGMIDLLYTSYRSQVLCFGSRWDNK